MSIYNVLTEARDEYLRWLGGGNLPVTISAPSRSKENNPQIYASALGACPLANAKKRNGIPANRPELLPENAKGGLHRMSVGNLVAERFVQEPMIWKYGNLAQPEVPMNDDLVRGRADLLYFEPDCINIMEIKSRAVDYGAYEVKMSDFYQLRSYQRIMQRAFPDVAVNAFIVAVNWYGLNVYELEPVPGGYIFIDQTGTPWKDKEKNKPEVLNDAALDAEIEWHLGYKQGRFTETPYPDLYDRERAWECSYLADADKPKYVKSRDEIKNGRITVRCPYDCHFGGANELPIIGRLIKTSAGKKDCVFEVVKPDDVINV
jgi:hypothetical protein